MSLLIPKGFKLVAQTECPGTGGAVGKAYHKPETKLFYFTLEDPVGETEHAMGPVDFRLLSTLDITLRDILDMKGQPLIYLEPPNE